MSKIFELIRPKSLDDSTYEDFEYLIRWMGRDGAEYLWMFYDAELGTDVTGEVINSEDSGKIQSLVSKVGQGITLEADDLSLSDVEVMKQIFENRYVTRLLKAGTVERYAPEPDSFRYRLRGLRYELTFNLVMVDTKAWR